MFNFREDSEGDYTLFYNLKDTELLLNILTLLNGGQADFTNDADDTWESCLLGNKARNFNMVFLTPETFVQLTNLFDTADIKYKVCKKVDQYGK